MTLITYQALAPLLLLILTLFELTKIYLDLTLICFLEHFAFSYFVYVSYLREVLRHSMEDPEHHVPYVVHLFLVLVLGEAW